MSNVARLTFAPLVAVLCLLWSAAAFAAPVSGVVYNARTGEPISGVRLQLFYDDNDLSEPGILVPEERLEAREQNQLSKGDGSYSFELPSGRIYRIGVTSSADHASFPSTIVPPISGFPLPGEIGSSTPGASGERPFYMRFDATNDNARFFNNHIALDQLGDRVTLDIKANRKVASTGDILSFSSTLVNNSGRNLRQAEGRGLFFSLALARGLTMNVASLRASVRSANGLPVVQAAAASRVSSSSDRLLRFGPFDVPAGSTLELSYQATVGIDTKSGRYETRIVGVNASGIALSPEATIQIAIAPDRDFSTSTILGRVFCDDDKDGVQGDHEEGVYGAKVYAAMGSVATTDAAGRFHLTRIPPGSHVFKLDKASLAGGKIIGEATKLLVLSEGLPMQLRYPVACVHTWIDSRSARVVLPLAPAKDAPEAEDAQPASTTMTVRGRIQPMTLSIDGRRRDLPSIALAADIPQSLVTEPATKKRGPRLIDVPVGGFASESPRWSVVWNEANVGAAKNWRFTIEKRSEAGALSPILHRSGEGAPPPVIEWNGLGDAGTEAASATYVARLTLTSKSGVEVATGRHAFATGGGSAANANRRVLLKGELVSQKSGKLVALAALQAAISNTAQRLGTAGRIKIEVHGDGAGDRLKSAVQTQSEAEFIKEQFVAAGVDEARIEARGRGASDPLDLSSGPEARKKNRRIVFIAEVPTIAAGTRVPVWVLGKQELRIAGRLTPIDAEGGFETVVPRPANGLLAVDMLAASGRRVALPIHVGETPDVDVEGGEERDYAVVGDLATQELRVDFATAPSDLWSVDAKLTAVGALPIPELQTELQGTERRLTSPLDFRLLVSEKLSVKNWELVIAAESGDIVHRVSKDGQVPAVLRWDGLNEEASFVLKSDQQYRYWLDIETADASGFSTTPRWFTVDPSQSAQVLDKDGRLFSKTGSPRANVKNLLSRFAARDAKKNADRFSIVLEVVGDRPRVDVVRAKFVSYLQKLGIQPGRYDIVARELVGKRDHLSIVRDARPSKAAPEVRINRRRVALDGSSFKENVKLPPGVPLIVEVQSASGAMLRYVSGQSDTSRADTAGGELIAPGPAALPPKPRELRDDEVLARDTPAKRLRAFLPPRGQRLQEMQLPVSGSAPGSSKVRINGKRVAVDEYGDFYVIVPLTIGKNTLVIRADDSLGGSSTIRWPVRVAKRHTIAVGMVEGVAATAATSRGWFADTAGLAGMGPDTTLQVGPVLLSARAQGFVKTRMPGGKFSESVEITAHINTARERDASAFFEQVIDPVRSDLTLGDDAAEDQVVNTRGKLYAKVVAGDSSAAVGSVRTRLEGGGELFSYDRTADGAVADLQRDIGDNHVAVRAFSTSDAIPSVRDVNWFRATGGSLYYLRHGHVLEGSEKVQITVRDRDSGLVLSTSVLARGVDYSVEYEGGRVRLTEPLTSANRSSWVIDNMDSSSTPMSGNLVYLSVQYEHEDNVTSAQQSRGAYASTTLEERLSVGAGIVSEERGEQDGYRLLGADASLHLGEHSHLSAEIAASRQRDASHFLSTDGGLSFGGLQRDTAFEAEGSGDSLSDMRLGWKLSADLALRDWTKAEEFRESSLSLYVQDLERGFASGSAVFDEGRFKFGGRLRHRISKSDMLLIRHEGQVSQQSRVGPTLEDVMANPTPNTPDERASYITSAQWARDVGRWHYKFEAMHQRITSTAALANDAPSIDVRRIGLGTMAAYDVSSRIRVHAGQQVVADQGDADPVLSPVSPMASASRSTQALAGLVSNVGGEFKLAPDLSVGADLYQRWNGDNALRVGLRNALSDRGSMYVQEQVGEVDGRLSNTTIVGAEDTFGADNGGRTYGEYQLNRGVLGNRNRSVLGLGRRWQVTESIGLGAGFEHQQAFGGYLPDGTSIGDARRNVGHTSITFAPTRTFRIAAQAELRLDHGDSGSGVDTGVLGADPREGQLPGGFADHDGVAQGAALIIAPGEQTQLLAGIGAEWRLADKHTWLARARSSSSTHTAIDADASRTIARFTELTTGWAFRPVTDDTLEFLSRYSYLHEQRPSLVESDVRTERSHVVALLPFARLPHRILLSGKLAYKWTEMDEAFAGAANLETRLSTILAIARLGYQFYGKWDASGEARVLGLWGTADKESKLGSLLEIGHTVGRHLRLGAGYNFSHFSDNELGDLRRDSHGFFFRMTGMY